jgi:hypothetical protein
MSKKSLILAPVATALLLPWGAPDSGEGTTFRRTSPERTPGTLIGSRPAKLRSWTVSITSRPYSFPRTQAEPVGSGKELP